MNIGKAEKQTRCTSLTFKSDLLELCDMCPITDEINEKITSQIVFQAEQRRDILSSEKFQDYLDKEIDSHDAAMRIDYLAELRSKDKQNDTNRVKRIRRYIWNKESIKALKPFMEHADTEERPSSIKQQTVVHVTFGELFKEANPAITVIDKLLEKGLIMQSDDQKYYWNTKKNQLVILAEWCKQKNLWKVLYSGYNTQKIICWSLCSEFNVDNPPSVYQTFKPSELLVHQESGTLFTEYQKKVEELNALLKIDLPNIT